MTAVRCVDLCKTYRQGDVDIRALDHVSIEISEGGFVCLSAPSGGGKTTLLNAIGGLDIPDSGEVWIAGKRIDNLSKGALAQLRLSHIGFVFQQFFLLDGMSAIDNVANGLIYQGVGLNERRERSAETLKRVGLGHRLTHPPSHMSGGERQRVAVARALVHEPAFVLADEPTGNLDSKSTGAVMDLIAGLHEEGTTIAVITHDTKIAASLPRQVTVFDGRIESDTALQSSYT